MKKLIMVVAVAAFALAGCVTGPNGNQVPDTARIAAVSREAASLGTFEALKANPGWKAQFELARVELLTLVAGDTITAAQLVDVLGRLPVKQLQGDTARIAISAAKILIAGAGWSVVPAEKLNQIRPIALAIAEGIQQGEIQAEPAFEPSPATEGPAE